MDSVVVLIAAPGSRAIDDRSLATSVGLMHGAHGRNGCIEGEALELAVPPMFGRGMRRDRRARRRSSDRRRRPAGREPPQAPAGRRHGFDHDRPGMHRRAGRACRRRRAHQATITARAMRGELDFEGALQERVALMKGLPESAIADPAANGSPSRRAAARWSRP